MRKPFSFYFIKKLDNTCFDVCLIFGIPFYKYIHFKKKLHDTIFNILFLPILAISITLYVVTNE